MDSNEDSFFWGLGIGLVSMSLFWLWMTSDCVPEKQVIEHGASYYHPETGDFTWREKTKASE